MIEICEECTRFKTNSQRVVDHVWTIIKKVWLSDFEIIEIDQQINRGLLFKLYQNNIWEVGIVKQRVGELVYIIQGPRTYISAISINCENVELMIRTFHRHKFAKSQLILYLKTLTSTHLRLLPRLDVQKGKGSLQILWASISFFFWEKKNLLEVGCYGTVTYSFMDSSKFYINQEPSTLEEIGYTTDIRLTSKPSLRHHFSLYLVTSIYL